MSRHSSKSPAAPQPAADNAFAALAVHRYAVDGYLGPHIEAINEIQRAKRDAMLHALERHYVVGGRYPPS